MYKTIVGVDFRHPLVTAYVQIVGRSEQPTEQSAKEVAEHIRQSLPDAQVEPPRFKGFSTKFGQLLFEVPVILGSVTGSDRAFFAGLLLKGSV